MKILTALISLFLIIGCQQNELKIIAEDDLINLIVKNEMPDFEKIEIFNQDGLKISLDSLKKLSLKNKMGADYYINKNHKVVKMVVRKRTAKDDKLQAKINKKYGEIKNQEIKPVEIICKNKVHILQEVYNRDQNMRIGKSPYNAQVDHENLELIISFLKKCGIPTLKEVDEEQMAGIWAVLQHAPPKYQSKYIPLLEESAKKGDIKWSTIALMKDRALMYEGKPQIYGSQIQGDKLYNLFEPEYVDQRRAEIGMSPINEYLQRFDIELNVEQKEK